MMTHSGTIPRTRAWQSLRDRIAGGVVAILVGFLGSLTQVNAAEIIGFPEMKDGTRFRVIAIDGDLQRGDYETFEEVVKNYGPEFNIVSIASKGGDVVEAMQIGRLIRKLKFGTYAPLRLGSRTILMFESSDPENSVCASACFLVFVAGVNRSGNVIAIHRPYLSDDTYREMGLEDAVEAYKSVKAMIASYLEGMGVSATYADRMFAIPKEELDWLEEKEIQRNFDGFIPEMAEWVKAQCPSLSVIESMALEQLPRSSDEWTSTDEEIADEIFKKKDVIFRCQTNVHRQVSCVAWLKHFKLSDGNSSALCSRYMSAW